MADNLDDKRKGRTDPPKSPSMGQSFEELADMMAYLRGPQGCPWDREQTHHSLKQYLLEEVYEFFDALEGEDAAHLREELGDLLLQVVFHAEIATEEGLFSLGEVLEDLMVKLMRRHPHIFGDVKAKTADEVLERWERIKKREKNRRSLLDGVPVSLPALLLAHKLQVKASRVGMDWEAADQVLGKIQEELDELKAAIKSGGEAEPEVGDVLFSVVNLARHLAVEPEEALRKVCQRFRSRFQYLEDEAAREGRSLREMSAGEKDVIWEEAKKKEADGL